MPEFVTSSRWDAVRARKRGERLGEPVHVCHALGCHVPVDASRLMCPRHWAMVPEVGKRAVWRWYVPGQEITKTPSAEYLRAALAAVEAVANKEQAAKVEQHTLF